MPMRPLKFLLLPIFLFAVIVSKAEGRIGVLFMDTTLEGRAWVVVTQVFPGSPAADAGIRTEDRIVSFNGQETRSADALRRDIAGNLDTAPVAVTILRNGQELTKQVRIYHPVGFWIQVIREGWSWMAVDYDVYVGFQHMGTITYDDTRSFFGPTDFSDSTSCIYVSADLLGDPSDSYRIPVDVKPGYMPVARFEAAKGRISLVISYKPLGDTATALYKRRLDAQEYAFYQYIVSDSTVAPKWFKRATLRSLEGVVDDKYRGQSYSVSLQCRPLYRLTIIFCLTYLISLIAWWKSFYRFLLVSAGVFTGMVLLAFLLRVLYFAFDMANPAYRIPVQFLGVCVYGTCLLIYVVYLITPFARNVNERKEAFLEFFGTTFGKILAVIELVVTGVEAFKMIRELFG